MYTRKHVVRVVGSFVLSILLMGLSAPLRLKLNVDKRSLHEAINYVIVQIVCSEHVVKG